MASEPPRAAAPGSERPRKRPALPSFKDLFVRKSGPRPAIEAPAQGEHLSREAKEAIAEMALGLAEEQLRARIVHYKADLSTNPELDAITARVVADLKELQAKATAVERAPASQVDVAAAQERLLRSLLERVVRADAPSLVVEKRLKAVHRNLARLFFQSELHEKTRGQDATKVIQHGEQAIYYLLVRYENRLKNELEGFEYADEDVRDRAFTLLGRVAKDMQDAFLSRRSTELKRILAAFNAVLVDFFVRHLPGRVAGIAAAAVAGATTDGGKGLPYRLAPEGVPGFRAAFERAFLQELVGFVEDPLVERLADTAGAVRAETLRFITDPEIFGMICREVCDGFYEHFCNEGFLELPVDWRTG